MCTPINDFLNFLYHWTNKSLEITFLWFVLFDFFNVLPTYRRLILSVILNSEFSSKSWGIICKWYDDVVRLKKRLLNIYYYPCIKILFFVYKQKYYSRVNLLRMSGCYYSFHIKVDTSRRAVAVKVVVTRNLTLLGNMFLRGLKIFPTHGRCIDACSINTKLSTKSKLVIYDLNLIMILMCINLHISGRILFWKIRLDVFCI